MFINEPTKQDIDFMNKVLAEVNRAAYEDKAAIGAMLTLGEEVIAFRHNTYRETRDSTTHEEMNILRATAKKIYEMPTNERSELCMYVTLEPCLMCMSAMSLTGIKRVVYSALSEDTGSHQWIAKDFTCRDLNTMLVHSDMELVPGVKREAGIALLKRIGKNT